ncbi:MAG: RHS repeat protein, partial [Phycisphaerales bacterium]|nr:RHS repeat protein [Phycisphaerales bacterium]
VTDPKGQTYLRYAYHGTTARADFNFDRAVSVTLGGIGEASTLAYSALTPAPANNSSSVLASVVDRNGHTHEHYFDAQNRCVMTRVLTAGLHPGEPAFYQTLWTFNGDGLVTRKDMPRGNFETWTYDSGNPSARARGNMLARTLHSAGLGTGGSAATITETWTYLGDFGGCCGTNFVTQHTDGRGGITTHDYDAAGNRVQTTHRIPTVIENWAYNAFGQVVRHIHPDNGSGCRRVDTVAYYAAGAQNGYAQSTIEDVGGPGSCAGPHFALATQYTYDARGNLVRRVDPRGNPTDYTYNEMDELVEELSRPIGATRYQTLSFYDANGNRARVDSQNVDETGASPAGNTHFTRIIDFEILNLPVRTTRELAGGGGNNLAQSVLRSADIPAPMLPEYLAVDVTAYDANRNRTRANTGVQVAGSDPFNATEWWYDERDLPYLIVSAPGAPGQGGQSTIRRDFNPNGKIEIELVALELVSAQPITYAYDGFDRLVRRLDETGNAQSFSYDANHNRTLERVDGELLDIPGSAGNTRLNERQYVYDAMDRLIRRDDAFFDTATQAPIGDGFSTNTTTYNDNSTVRSATNDNGATRTFTYDTMERRAVVTDAVGNTSTSAYDANGNEIGRTRTDVSTGGNPAQVFTDTYTYDALDRLVVSMDTLGASRTYLYDSRSNLVVQTDRLGHGTRYEYDGLDRLVRSIRDMDATGPDGSLPDIVTLQQWDESSRMTLRIDDSGNPTRYVYDSLDRIVRTTRADGLQLEYQYDQRGNRVRLIDADGTQVDSVFDAHDRRVQNNVTPAPGLAPAPPPPTNGGVLMETYQYDGLSRLVRATDEDSSVTRGYDSLGHMTRETQQITQPASPVRTVTAVYDGMGNQTRLSYPGGRVITRTHDALDRTATVADAAPAFAVATYSYIGPRRIERRDFGNATRSEYTYDALGRLVRSMHSDTVSGSILDDRSVGHDAEGNKLSWTDALIVPAATRTYSYDAADRLVASLGPSYWPTTSYGLDGTGKRSAVSGGNDAGAYSCDPTLPVPGDCQLGHYTLTPIDSRTYDDAGNLRGATSQIATVSRTLAYDHHHRLVRHIDSTSGATTVYKYDCLGRRIQKAVGAVISKFYYDGDEEIEEQNAANVTVATHVHSKNSRCVIASSRGTARFYLHEDDQGNIVKVTNANRQVTNMTEYGDFGRPFTPNGPQSGDLVYSIDSDRDAGPTGLEREVADDFWLPQTNGPLTLNGLTFRGGYDYGAPLLNPDQFRIRIYHSDPGTGAPQAVLLDVFLSGPQVTRNPTGRTLCCNDFPNSQEFQYQCTLPSPITLQPGIRYWLSIQNGTFGDPTTWGWETSDDGNGRVSVRDNEVAPWDLASADFAFSLMIVGLAAPSQNPFAYLGRRYDAETGYTVMGGRALDHRIGSFIQDYGDTDGILGEWLGMTAGAGSWATFARNNPVDTELPLHLASWWDGWLQVAEQEKKDEKKCCVEKFEVKWTEPSAAAKKQSPGSLVEIQVEITFGSVKPCDPSCCAYSQQVMTVMTISDGPNKGFKADTSPMHDDGYSRDNDGTDGNDPDDQDGKPDKSDPGFKTSDIPGKPGLDDADVIDYKFTAAQYVHDTCNGGALVAQRGPHTAHITGKVPRDNNKTLPKTLDKDPPKK